MEEKKSPGPAWFRQPIWLGVAGLALAFVGFQLAFFVPQTALQQKVSDLRNRTDDAEYHRRLDRFARNAEAAPPYRWPGRMVMLAGVVLFVSAGVLMARRPAAPAEGSVPDGEGETAGLRGPDQDVADDPHPPI